LSQTHITGLLPTATTGLVVFSSANLLDVLFKLFIPL